MELKAQEKTGLLLMPTAKVTKNVSAAEGGGNVLCSILISIKTKAWLYSFGCTIYKISSNRQMMKTDLNYCIVLSIEQLTYLTGSKYGIDRMKILHRLIEEAVLKETNYAIKGFSTTLQVGQAVLSEVDLSNKLGYDKKSISRVLDKMNQLGIVASTQNNRTSVHTLKCISAWMENGNRIDNPFYVRIKNRQEEGENTGALSNDAKPLLPTPPLEENVSNSNDYSQSEVMNEGCISDTDFSFEDKLPVISDKGELLSSSFSFPSASVSPPPAREEESNEDVSADGQT